MTTDEKLDRLNATLERNQEAMARNLDAMARNQVGSFASLAKLLEESSQSPQREMTAGFDRLEAATARKYQSPRGRI